MAGHAGDNGSSIDRALGRLEGRVSVVETQLTNLDARMTRQLDAVATKMGDLERSFNAFKNRLAGNWHVIVIFGACFVGLVSLAASVINMWRHW